MRRSSNCACAGTGLPRSARNDGAGGLNVAADVRSGQLRPWLQSIWVSSQQEGWCSAFEIRADNDWMLHMAGPLATGRCRYEQFMLLTW
jgi:hypothetical protein